MSTDKAVVEIPSPVSGRVLTIAGKPGDVVAVGAELASFDTADAGGAAAAPPAASPKAPAAPPGTANTATPAPGGSSPAAEGPVRASPATRRRAQEAGINLASLAGTGTGGRITPGDFQARWPSLPRTGPKAPAPAPVAANGSSGDSNHWHPARHRSAHERAARSIPHFSQ
jgi:pyruvate/2-oxoglutarate dehydrogenase complex dihydrolipoamide acyltransferase (E2) component